MVGKANPRNGGSLFLDVLRNREVNNIYCCPGTTEVSIIDATVSKEDINFVLFPFEGPAVAAADGHARITGKPQVVMLHANVGLANGITQIYSACMSHTPLVVINVVKPRALLSHGGITTAMDEQEMVKQYTRWHWMSLRPEELKEDINRAFQMAIKSPSGPTLLVIPQDVLEHPACEESVYTFPQKNRSYNITPGEEELKKAAALMAESSFPVIISGAGVGKEGCTEEVSRLAELVGAGVCCESRRSLYHNSYPTGERHFLGPYSSDNPYIEKADLIVALGAKAFVEFRQPDALWPPEGVKFIHLHEDLGELDKLYQADVALCGKVAGTVRKLYDRVAPLVKDREERLAERNEEINKLHIQRKEDISRKLREIAGKKPIRVATLVEKMSKFMDGNTTVVVDTPTSDAHLVEYLERPDCLSFYGHGSGSLGWGTGAALGAKWGAPGRKVICVTGDGSFLFGIQGLWVAYKHQVPVVFVVINNQRYAAVRSGLLKYSGEAVSRDVFPGTDISGINYAGVAKNFGIEAERVEEPGNIYPALQRALNKGEPYFLELMVDPDDF